MRATSFSLIAVALNLFFTAVYGATYSNATKPFSRASSDTSPTTTFSSIDGPYLLGYSYTWTQYITPTTIGTIEIIINTDTNRTYTTTKTNTEFVTNGTLSILTRTDINAAGTVTAVEQDLFGYNVTVAYPTPILALASEFTWNAILPSAVNETPCCYDQLTYSPTPTHTPFASPTGTTDSVDPSGWLYTLTGISYGEAGVQFSSSNISSLWSGQSIGILYTGCGYAICDVTYTTVAAASYAVAQAYLFATSTITTSGSDPSSAAEASAPLQSTVSRTAVEVDPITASPTSALDLTTSRSSSVEVGSVAASPTPTSPSVAVSTEEQSTPSVSVSSSLTTAAISISSATSAEPLRSTTAQPSTTNSALLQSITPHPGTDSVETTSTTSGNIAALIASGIGLATAASTLANVAVGGSTKSVPTPQTESPGSTTSVFQAPAAITIGDATITVDASSQFLLSGQTLTPGSPISIGDGSFNTVVDLSTGLSETVLQVGTSVTTINRPGSVTSINSAGPIVVGGSTITPDASSWYIISGQTLVPESSVTVGSESSTTVIALSTELSKTILQIRLSISTIYASPIAPTTDSVLPIVVESSIITRESSLLYIVSGQTLGLGSTITVGSGLSAAIVALQTSGSQTLIVVDSSTSTLHQQQANPTLASMSDALPSAFTIGSSIVSLNSASEYVIASQTLQPGGPAITVSGSLTISLASDATELVVGTSTLEVVVASRTGSGEGNMWSAATGADAASSPSSSSSRTVSSESSGAPSVQQSSGVGGSGSATAESSAKTTSANNSGSRQHQEIRGQLGVLVTICLTILLGAL